jgi:hypothetical protein
MKRHALILDEIDSNPKVDFFYSLDPHSVFVDNATGSLTAILNLNCVDASNSVESKLDLSMWFYQNGIMRTLIEEPESKRFRISQEGLPVVDEQLIPVSDL